jgi:hypothetical protein
MNTAIAGAQEPVQMAQAMKHAVLAGRLAYLSGRIPRKMYATASSPIEGWWAAERPPHAHEPERRGTHQPHRDERRLPGS